MTVLRKRDTSIALPSISNTSSTKPAQAPKNRVPLPRLVSIPETCEAEKKTEKKICAFIPTDLRENIVHEFVEYGKTVFEEQKANLKCPKCQKIGSFTNKGIGGKPAQGGIKEIQILCNPKLGGCSSATRLLYALDKSSGSEYEKALILAKQIGQHNNTNDVEEAILNDSESDVEIIINPDFSDDVKLLHDKIKYLENENLLLRTKLEAALDRLTLLENSAQAKAATIDAKGVPVAIPNIPLKTPPGELGVYVEESTSEVTGPNETISSDNKAHIPSAPLKNRKEKLGAHVEKLASEVTEAGSNDRWTEVVKKNLKKKAKLEKKCATIFTGHAAKPKVIKIHLKIKDKSAFRNAKDSKDVNNIIRNGLKGLGISDNVITFSKIGNSVLEIYVDEDKVSKIKEQIGLQELELISNFDPEGGFGDREAPKDKIIKRLSYLYRRYASNRIRTAILDGYSDEIQESIKNSILESTEKNTDSPSSE